MQNDIHKLPTWGDTTMTTTIILSMALAIAAYYLIAVPRQEVADCLTWQSQAQEYPKFYLLQWQADQCTAHGIIINAPIK